MAPDPSQPLAVTVRIERAEAARFGEIVRLLEGVGLTEAAPHPRFGIVNGLLPAARLADARAIAGVASVREDAGYRAIRE